MPLIAWANSDRCRAIFRSGATLTRTEGDIDGQALV